MNSLPDRYGFALLSGLYLLGVVATAAVAYGLYVGAITNLQLTVAYMLYTTVKYAFNDILQQ